MHFSDLLIMSQDADRIRPTCVPNPSPVYQTSSYCKFRLDWKLFEKWCSTLSWIGIDICTYMRGIRIMHFSDLLIMSEHADRIRPICVPNTSPVYQMPSYLEFS